MKKVLMFILVIVRRLVLFFLSFCLFAVFYAPIFSSSNWGILATVISAFFMVGFIENKIEKRSQLKIKLAVKKIPLLGKKKLIESYNNHVNQKFTEIETLWIEDQKRRLKINELKKFLINDPENLNNINFIEELDNIRLKAISHFPALKRNISQSLKRNDYGAIIQDNRVHAAHEFLQSIGYTPKYLVNYEIAANDIISFVEIYDELLKDTTDFDPENIPSNGLDFEHWVAENLNRFGWSASATQGSGYQGLDELAEKDNIRVGIQCKLYTKPVGNKAVQEIIAAKNYFDLDHAVVITNTTYTKSAKHLAEKANVLLLSQYDISKFDDIFLC